MEILQLIALFVTLCTGPVLTAELHWTKNWPNQPSNVFLEKMLEKERYRRAASEVPECKDGYDEVGGSTMCEPDSPDYIEGSSMLSEADKQLILDMHNKYRAIAVPPAKQMMKLYWNDELEKTAQKWAKQCTIGHNGIRARYIPKYNSVPGQNGGYHLPSWEAVITAWYSEVAMFRFGEDPDSYLGQEGWVKIGHYSMMSVDEAALVGCGYAKCNSKAIDYYFCNYFAGPKLIAFPYRVGLPCAKCQNNCTRNLCDCSGIYCFNGGTIDPNTCMCKCIFPFRGQSCLDDPCNGKRCKYLGELDIDTCHCECFYPYSGEVCEIKNCNPFRPDLDRCYTQPSEYCIFPTTTRDCPLLCGVCVDNCPELRCLNGRKSNCTCKYPCPGKSCENAAKLNLDTCKCDCVYPYEGKRCENKVCTGLLDSAFCNVFWPTHMCSSIQITSRCPVMCDTCPGVCPVKCENSGRQRADCSCFCNYPFTGTRCESKSCAAKLDPWDCGRNWPEEYCPRFSNVRAFCPAMCGICPAVCGGKLCANGGTLDFDTCKCACIMEYQGDRCEDMKCNGKKCLNYGVMNYDTCYCFCPPNWTGDICNVWACPESDPFDCGTAVIPKYQCFTHWDVPFICPHLCGHCPGTTTAPIST